MLLYLPPAQAMVVIAESSCICLLLVVDGEHPEDNRETAQKGYIHDAM